LGRSKNTHGGAGGPVSGGAALQAGQVRALEAALGRVTGARLRPGRRARLVAEVEAWLGESGVTFEELLARVERGGPEQDWLVGLATVHRTEFFREPEAIVRVRDEMLGELATAGARSVRLWSAGCASGEEAFSLALACAERAGKLGLELEVLGTDIDVGSIERARLGIYAEEALGKVPRELAERWFVRGRGRSDGFVRVREELRRRVRFERLNLIGPAWVVPGPFDAIFCRNVAIYFDSSTGAQVLERLHGELAPRGWLALGNAESARALPRHFEELGGSLWRRAEPAALRKSA
jgi:chemotaxis protein methyltransferase CheR